MAARRFKEFLSAVTMFLPVACVLQPFQTQPVNTASIPVNTGAEGQCSTLGNLLCGAVSMVSGETTVEGRPVCVARVESAGKRIEQCVSAAGGSQSSNATLTKKPQQIAKQEPTPPTATLSWKDNSSNEMGFRIYRIAGNHITKIAEVGPNITSYVDRAAPSNACYVVVAFNSAGESSPTAKACLSD